MQLLTSSAAKSICFALGLPYDGAALYHDHLTCDTNMLHGRTR